MAQDDYRCRICGMTFRSQADLEDHNRAMHSQYTCQECGETFSSDEELQAHNRLVHEQTPR